MCLRCSISISCISVVVAVAAVRGLDKDGAPVRLNLPLLSPLQGVKMSPGKGSLPPGDTDCRARPIRFHCSTGRGVRQSANQTRRGLSRRVESLCVLSLYDLITCEQPAVPAGTWSSSLSACDAALDQQQMTSLFFPRLWDKFLKQCSTVCLQLLATTTKKSFKQVVKIINLTTGFL